MPGSSVRRNDRDGRIRAAINRIVGPDPDEQLTMTQTEELMAILRQTPVARYGRAIREYLNMPDNSGAMRGLFND